MSLELQVIELQGYCSYSVLDILSLSKRILILVNSYSYIEHPRFVIKYTYT